MEKSFHFNKFAPECDQNDFHKVFRKRIFKKNPDKHEISPGEEKKFLVKKSIFCFHINVLNPHPF